MIPIMNEHKEKVVSAIIEYMKTKRRPKQGRKRNYAKIKRTTETIRRVLHENF